MPETSPLPIEGPLGALLHSPIGLLFGALWGAAWGSFYSLAIHRLSQAALADESETWIGSARHALGALRTLVHPGSRCPTCQTPIRWYDNVPLVGWLLLRGRCRSCGEKISPRYLVVELLSLALAVSVYLRFVEHGAAPPSILLARFFVYFFFCGTLLALTVIDLELFLLPLSITLPSIPAFFVAGRLLPDVLWSDALIGAMVGFCGLWLLRNGYKRLTGRDGLGGGDEMLVAMIGGLLGWQALPVTLFLGATLGLVVSVPILALRRRWERAARPEEVIPLRFAEVPFGPFLALGALAYLFLGRADLRSLFLLGSDL